jgi:hypothetical protein
MTMPRTKRNLALIAMARQSNSPTTRVMLGRYFAEIVADADESIFHWLVQREGSNELLQLGQEYSFSSALESANNCIDRLVARSRGKVRCPVLYGFERRR